MANQKAEKQTEIHNWNEATFRGYQSLDIYSNSNDDIVIRMEGRDYDIKDQIVIIPRIIAGYVINALSDELLAGSNDWELSGVDKTPLRRK